MTDQPDTTPPAQAVEPAADQGIVARPDIGRGSAAVMAATLTQRVAYATELAKSGLIPKAFRGSPANILLAIEQGTMLGIHPMAALNGIHVIEGKPTISPALMTALVRRAGHKVRVRVEGSVEEGNIKVTATVIRSDDPDAPFTATWTLPRAVRAGLCTTSVDPAGVTHVRARSSRGDRLPWEAYTEAMLKARAIGEACREAAEDALCGVHYTPEELGALVDVEGEVIAEHTPEPEKPLDPVAVRDAIMGARSRMQVGERLQPLGVAEWLTAENRYGFDGPRLKALLVEGRYGGQLSAWALLAEVAPSLPVETPAEPPTPGSAEDVQDAEVVPDETPAAGPAADQSTEEPPTDPWKAQDAAQAAQAGQNDEAPTGDCDYEGPDGRLCMADKGHGTNHVYPPLTSGRDAARAAARQATRKARERAEAQQYQPTGAEVQQAIRDARTLEYDHDRDR